MKNHIRLFVFIMLLFSVFAFSSCDSEGSGGKNPTSNQTNEQIIIPEINELTRETVNFDDVVYIRPDTENLVTAITRTTDIVEGNEGSYEEQLAAIKTLEEPCSIFNTMYAYLTVKTSQNSADKTWAEEYEALSGEEPRVAEAIEKLYVAVARSEHAERFEEDYFGDGHIEKYSDGGKYTDAAVELLEREAELTAKYSALSSANVKIVYGGISDTYDNTAERLKSTLGEGTKKYKKAIAECDLLFAEAVDEAGAEIFTELLKVRYKIAEAMGYGSYMQYAYELRGHDYTADELNSLINNVAKYVTPVYQALSTSVFGSYFRVTPPIQVTRESVINNLYTVYSSMDTRIADVYEYMLSCGLYDIAGEEKNRMDGAYTVYFHEIEAPFIFATVSGDITDYSTISHDFGHFLDGFINYSVSESLDLAEVSSQALELLTLCELDEIMGNEEYKYLYYSAMQNTLLTLITQSFYAKLEALAYELEYEDITRDRLDLLVREAAAALHLNPKIFSSLDKIMIDHLVLYPFYVQSYCTSLTVSLDIFFEECEDGNGIELYNGLIDEGYGKTFCEALEDASLDSPFDDDTVKELVDKIYYSIIGSYYFKNPGDINNAA